MQAMDAVCIKKEGNGKANHIQVRSEETSLEGCYVELSPGRNKCCKRDDLKVDAYALHHNIICC